MSNFEWPPAKNEAHEHFGEDFSKLAPSTRISVSHAPIPRNADPLIMPIYHSSTYRFRTMAQFHEPNHGNNYVYQRCGNPTVENVEVIINEIEGGAATLLYNSGLAAASAVFLEFLSAGDHLIAMKPCYSGTYSFLTETLSRFGVKISFADSESDGSFADILEKCRTDKTKMVFIEGVANPSMAVPDILGTFEFAKKHKIMSFVDATFASPINFKPIKLGADISLHSCSKYIGGHSDVIAGCVTTKAIEHWQRLKLQQMTMGNALSPYDASLLARGLKTLDLRVQKINGNAQQLAEFLEAHSKVIKVFYPGLKSHPRHAKAKEALTGFGGMIAFDLGSAQKAIQLVETLRIISHAVSLGGTESLIEHPASMSHGEELLRDPEAPKVSPGLLRFSVGVEQAEDLIADLERALEKL
ncbi:unnamed protein product [Auanema sp. JU1783]|nr:unnamed protein product [Auanema sp. JU1783]